jgi:hypothetical protein
MSFYKLSCYTSLLPSVCTWSFDFFNDGVVEFQEIFIVTIGVKNILLLLLLLLLFAKEMLK